MSFDLASSELRAQAAAAAWWQDPASYYGQLHAATRQFAAPLAVIDVAALSYNAHDLLRRAAGTPIRLASKSLRVRGALETVLQMPGFAGVLGYTLPEALWLSETISDIVVAYPTADREAIKRLAGSDVAASRITLMVDDLSQLDLIDSVVSPARRPEIRLCIDFDASWRSRLLGNVGVLRSGLHTPAELRDFARAIMARAGFRLCGVMSYEAQIAGVGDNPRANPLLGQVLRQVQRASYRELRRRRAAGLAALRNLCDLEFVNVGGTGSLELSAAEPGITEVSAGSGLFGPHLFDNYRSFKPAPAEHFALDVVRKPRTDVATLLGGVRVASGPPGADRLPQICWPARLRYAPREGSGEVQTPVLGASAANLRVGDRVWFRHTKAGEAMEQVTQVLPVLAGAIGDPWPTYRGEGKCFL